MGFVGNSDEHASRFAGIGAEIGFDPARLSGDQLHALLRDLTIEEESAPA